MIFISGPVVVCISRDYDRCKWTHSCSFH